MIMKNIVVLAIFIGLGSAGPPTPPTTTSIDPGPASSNGFPTELLPTTPTTPTTPPTTPVTTTVTQVTTSQCPPYTSHHHHHHHHPCEPDCRRRDHKDCKDKYHHKDKCCTTTKTCVIDKTPCCVLVWPCPTNTTSYITSTSIVCSSSSSVAPTSASVAPTSASVAPTSAAVIPVAPLAPACTPCTSYVTVTTTPALVCTTMIFCDIAGQSENCKAQNDLAIERIAERALRQGGQVFVNGELVVFETASGSGSGSGSGSSSGSSTVLSGSSVVTVTGLESNDAAVQTGATFVGGLIMVAAAFLFA